MDSSFNQKNIQTFLTNSAYLNEKVKTWLVRFKLIEIKNLNGPSETVYCVVQIAGQKYTSAEKSSQNLKFDEVRLNNYRLND